MTDEERPVLLLTCSGISHTGQLTTLAGRFIRTMHPALLSRHLVLTGLARSLGEELDGDERLVVVDGCDQCCAKKRVLLAGKAMDGHIVATAEGIARRGMEEPRFDEIQRLSHVIVGIVKNDGHISHRVPPGQDHE
ncbi:MAG: putative zinc-binding protein [Methanolinea sp.]|nr:putative zinc-binding protein [Methanolinea sp.]